LTGGAAAAATAGAAVCAQAAALAARLPIAAAAAARRNEMEGVKRIGNPPESGAAAVDLIPTTQESCQAAGAAVSARVRRNDRTGGCKMPKVSAEISEDWVQVPNF
jgi:hypothetical protein